MTANPDIAPVIPIETIGAHRWADEIAALLNANPDRAMTALEIVAATGLGRRQVALALRVVVRPGVVKRVPGGVTAQAQQQLDVEARP